MPIRLNLDYLNIPANSSPTPTPSDIIDVEKIIATHLINNSIAGSNVIVSDSSVELETPAVFISATSIIGNKNEGLWETTVLAYCIEDNEYAALNIAHKIVKLLDGYGGNGISDVEHISTIPQRNTETAPNIHTFAVSFRVLHQEL